MFGFFTTHLAEFHLATDNGRVMANNSKDYEPAIEAFNRALTEHWKQDTLKKLNGAERAKKDLEQQEYYDPITC
jgi:hypothetical protein